MADVLLKSLFATHALSNALGAHRTVVDPAGELVEDAPHFTEVSDQFI